MPRFEETTLSIDVVFAERGSARRTLPHHAVRAQARVSPRCGEKLDGQQATLLSCVRYKPGPERTAHRCRMSPSSAISDCFFAEGS